MLRIVELVAYSDLAPSVKYEYVMRMEWRIKILFNTILHVDVLVDILILYRDKFMYNIRWINGRRLGKYFNNLRPIEISEKMILILR